MINPHNSPWNKPKPVFIADQSLYFRWKLISKHLTRTPDIRESHGYLKIDEICYIAKNTCKMRLYSQIDWCWYTPKTLADAINSSSLEQYYEIMLNDIRSDPNVWKDADFELELKTHYAVRAGRASLI